MTATLTRLTLAALLAAGLAAGPAAAAKPLPQRAGSLKVYDDAKLFSAEGIGKAETTLSGATFEDGLGVTIDTYKEIPEGKKGQLKDPKSDAEKARFFAAWAKESAKNDKAKGIYILVCRSPGYVEIIADRETRERGFDAGNEKALRDTLLTGFREAAKAGDEAKQTEVRDAALARAAEYVVSDLKGTKVEVPANAKAAHEEHKTGGSFMSGIGGWLCIGLAALVGVWLVIGVVRAFTGNRGGGGGGGYGPGGGGGGFGGGGGGFGGGGGGGFMSGMLGGLFGAVAGNYLYNNVFGGHTDTSSGALGGGGSDAYAGDNSSNADTGAGDFSGDAGTGGGYDDTSGDAGGGYDGGGGFDDGGGGGGYDGGGDFGGGDGGGGDF